MQRAVHCAPGFNGAWAIYECSDGCATHERKKNNHFNFAFPLFIALRARPDAREYSRCAFGRWAPVGRKVRASTLRNCVSSAHMFSYTFANK